MDERRIGCGSRGIRKAQCDIDKKSRCSESNWDICIDMWEAVVDGGDL